MNSNRIKNGFSLIEVLISLSIFSVVLAGMGPAFMEHSRYNTKSEISSEAIAIGEQTIDNLRFEDPTQLPNYGSTQQNIVLGSRTYSSTTSYCLNTQYCNSPNNRHITVAVSYKNKILFSTQTVFTQLR